MYEIEDLAFIEDYVAICSIIILILLRRIIILLFIFSSLQVLIT